MRARAAVVATAAGVTGLRSEPPLTVRCVGEEVWIVGSAGGPVGGDELRLDVRLRDTRRCVRSAAAQVVLPSRTGEAVHVDVDVHVRGGALRWEPEPVVLARGARLEQRTTVRLEEGAQLRWREEVVLGRHGEAGGEAAVRLRVERDGVPLHHSDLSLHPASIGDARVIATLVLVGDRTPLAARTLARDDARGARLPLAAGGEVVLALGRRLEAVRQLVEQLAAA